MTLIQQQSLHVRHTLRAERGSRFGSRSRHRPPSQGVMTSTSAASVPTTTAGEPIIAYDLDRKARRSAVVVGFMTAAGLLLGAAVAWFAAVAGGSHRDGTPLSLNWRMIRSPPSSCSPRAILDGSTAAFFPLGATRTDVPLVQHRDHRDCTRLGPLAPSSAQHPGSCIRTISQGKL